MFSSAKDDWTTPIDLFKKWDNVFCFNLDAASSDDNALCKRHFTKADDGLAQSWGGCRVWLNPPYGREIGKWVEKAYTEAQKPNTSVVCLLPARTDTQWFHDYCTRGRITFLRGRLKFGDCKNSAPFPSMIVVFGNN